MAADTQARKAIINADDFGFSPGVTAGILRAHREGVVTSTTIMTNMPGAGEALALAGGAPGLGIGVHLNACQGQPLSKEGLRLAGADGRMNRTATSLMLACTLRPWLLRAVEAEFDAQIRWLLDHGRRPTHLDSHRHVHAFSPIFARVVALANRYDIRCIRWPYERLPGGGWPPAAGKQRRVRWLINRFSQANALFVRPGREVRGTWGIAHTGRIDEEWLCRAAAAIGDGLTEIMTHPGDVEPGPVGETTRLTDSRRMELAAICSPRVRAAFEAAGVTLVHYGQV